MELTLIIMLSKTEVFTTHLPVLCSIASLTIILSATWRIKRLSLLFVPPIWRRNGDYYVFQSDGRHRTLAAQSLDTYIPVLVTGSYTRND